MPHESDPMGDERPATLSALLSMSVLSADGEVLGHIQDIQLARSASSAEPWGPTAASTLIADGRHAGSLLGYDRRGEQGPAVLRVAMGWLHRRARILRWEDVDLVRTDDGAALRVRAGREGTPLRRGRARKGVSRSRR